MDQRIAGHFPRRCHCAISAIAGFRYTVQRVYRPLGREAYGREFKLVPEKHVELNREFIVIPVDMGSETMQLSLSFKHVHRVELLNPGVPKGGGIVLHINDFMANKLQQYLEKDGTSLVDFKCSYSSHKLIVLDIVDCKDGDMNLVHRVLCEASLFNHQHLVQRMNRNNKRIKIDMPLKFLTIIPRSQWIALFAVFGRNLEPQDLTMQQPTPRRIIADSATTTQPSTITFEQQPHKVEVLKPKKSSAMLDLQNATNGNGSQCVHQQQQHPQRAVQQQQRLPPPLPPHLHVRNANLTMPAAMRMLHMQNLLAPQQKQQQQNIVNLQHAQNNGNRMLGPRPAIPLQSSSYVVVKEEKFPIRTEAPTPFNHHPSLLGGRKPVQPSQQLLPQQIFFDSQGHGFRISQPQQMPTQTQKIIRVYDHPRILPPQPQQPYPSPPPPPPPTQQQSTSTAAVKKPPVPQQQQTTFVMTSKSTSVGEALKALHQAQPVMAAAKPRAPPQPSTSVVTAKLQSHKPKLTPKAQQKQHQEIHLIDDDEEPSTMDSQPSVSTVSTTTANQQHKTLFSYPPNTRDNCTVHYSDLKHLAIDMMLNDTVIDFYLKYIHHSLVPTERRSKIHIFNTFFFGRLIQAPPTGKPNVTLPTKLKRVHANFNAVKNWTKKVDLFDMDYIVVPINEEIHWYLAIVVNLRAGVYPPLKKDLDKPYVIVLNSLIDPAVDKHLEVKAQLAEYFFMEYLDKHPLDTSKGIQEQKRIFSRDSLQAIQPALTPQQKGYIDCGIFLLQFAELFLTRPPKSLSDKAAFCTWFPDFQIREKRDEIKDVIRTLAPEVKPSAFIYHPPPITDKKGRKPRKKQPFLEVFPLLARDRKQSESRLDEIAKDPRFSVLYRPRSLDSLIRENKEKPLLLQPPTITEMRRFRRGKDPLTERVSSFIRNFTPH